MKKISSLSFCLFIVAMLAISAHAQNCYSPTTGQQIVCSGSAAAASSVKVVRVATATNTNINTSLQNGDTIDGVVVSTGDSVLLMGQSPATNNGIYTIVATGTGVRSSEMATASDAAGVLVWMREGTYASVMYQQSLSPAIVGTNSLAFSDIGNTVAAEYGENNGITNGGTFAGTLADIPGSSFTLPSAGTWDIAWALYGENSATAANTVAMYSSANVIVPNSGAQMSNSVTDLDMLLVGFARITTTGSATYKLRGEASSGTFTVRNTYTSGAPNGGHSKIIYRKISGYLPVSGQQVDYLHLAQVATGATNTVNGSVLKYTNTPSGNIPYNSSTGRFALTAGKTYRLQATINNSENTFATFQWRNETANAYIGSQGNLIKDNGTQGAQAAPIAEAVFSPTVNTEVSIWLKTGQPFTLTGSASTGSDCWVNITQLGSSATTTVDLAAEYGEAALGTDYSVTTAFADTGLQVTLPSAGTYIVRSSVSGQIVDNTTTGTVIRARLSDGTSTYGQQWTVVGRDEDTTTSSSNFASGSGEAIITTTGALTVKLQAIINNAPTTALIFGPAGGTGGQSRMSYQKISGFTPTSGQTVDYVHVGSATVNQPTVANSAVVFPTILSGNIPYNTSNGQFSLTAGKTYRLEGAPTGGTVYWYNVTGAANLSEDSSGSGTGMSATLEGVAYFTPSVNSIVELRATSTSLFTSANGIGGGSFTARIQQIGSSAVIAGVYPGTWTSYTPTIGSFSGTQPTKATGAVESAVYKVEGKTLHIQYNYYAASATGATAGQAGVPYTFSLPAGYTIDTTKAPLPSVISSATRAGIDGANLGAALMSVTGGSQSYGKVVPLTTTSVGIYDNPDFSLVRNGRFTLNVADVFYSFSIQVPIN